MKFALKETMTIFRLFFMPALICLLMLAEVSCGSGNSQNKTATSTTSDVALSGEQEKSQTPAKSFTAMRLDSLGLVNIADTDPRIAVSLVYATPDNFVGEVLYGDLTEAYLLPEAAAKISAAQDLLEELKPGYRLIVYDAARPMSVQRKMRRIAEATGKQYYVANPANGGGLHNYGAAVDVSILDEKGLPISMGTEYDHLGPEANIDRENTLVSKGVITSDELENRLLLRSVMRQAGFRTVTSEWWHFNHVSRQQAQQKYPLIDF